MTEVKAADSFWGSRPLSESSSIAMAALEHLGKGYRITRELHPNFIDCSTLVSQSHWIGAAVQVPFIADSQLRATNAKIVDIGDVIPGDAIFAYKNGRESPGGRHNHVALYMGTDPVGRGWAAECREERGARLVELRSLSFGGGVRRFAPNPLVTYPMGEWSWFVRRVPKLGRLGSRLTSRYAGNDRHRGTDIYVSYGSVIRSPLTGNIIDVYNSGKECFTVDIWCKEKSMRTVIGPILADERFRVGTDVESGTILGLATYAPGPGGCNVVAHSVGCARVHWELWTLPDFGASPAPMLTCERERYLLGPAAKLVPQNVVYALKLGHVDAAISNVP